jgi:hypothetical protein
VSAALTEAFRRFPQYLQADPGIVPQTRARPLPFIAFLIHCSFSHSSVARYMAGVPQRGSHKIPLIMFGF